MNSLSWMIYAAEVLDRASAAFGFLTLVAFVGAAFAVIASFAIESDPDAPQAMIKPLRRMWLGPVFTGAIALFSPSSSTVYMMAASEAGETIITNPEAREVFNDLKTIIKSKLKEQLPKP